MKSDVGRYQWRKGVGERPGQGASVRRVAICRWKEGLPARAGQGGALGRARKLAAGYQPAVIKVVSYARGVARATAIGQYIQREEVVLETYDGRMLEDREAVAEEMKAWSTSFAKRAESQDVVALRLRLEGVRDTPEGRERMGAALAAGFSGHRYAARIDITPSGELEARAVVAMAGSAKERFRVRDERVGDGEASTMRRKFRYGLGRGHQNTDRGGDGAGGSMLSFWLPAGTSHGRDGVTYRLNKLVEAGTAIDDRGRPVANVADTRSVAREWGRSLRSQSSRDTMHLIISAKAGTDVAALTSAARAFLHDRFADHKFMFGVHTDKEADGHIHAHAVITVKNEAGQKIHPEPGHFPRLAGGLCRTRPGARIEDRRDLGTGAGLVAELRAARQGDRGCRGAAPAGPAGAGSGICFAPRKPAPDRERPASHQHRPQQSDSAANL